MPASQSAKDFFRPLAVGAPTPLTEIPFRPSRAIHFFDPSNAKMAAKVPAMVGTVDVLLGNLEDAVKADNKLAARQGLIEIGRSTEGLGAGGPTQLWTRINSLDSPWALDDLTALVEGIGDKLDVIMVPKVQGPRTSTTSTGCSPSSRPRPGSTGRSSCTRSSRPRAAWPTSRRSAAPRPACRASASARPTSRPTVA